eukprot:403368575
MIGTEKSADIFQLVNIGREKVIHHTQQLNELLREQEPTTIIFATIASIVVVQYGICFMKCTLNYLKNFRANIMKTIFNVLLYLPPVQSKLQSQKDKIREDFRKQIRSKRANQVYKLPQTPWREDTIMNRMQQGSDQAKQYYTNGGKISGGVYTSNNEHWDFISDCMRLHIESNPLHIVEFSYVGQLEAEIIKMALELYHAPQDSCGLLTSGGTESIFLSVLAYREQGKERGIKKPNIVANQSVHAGFNKACFYLGVEIRIAPLNKEQRCDLNRLFSLVDSNTVCIVGSSPEFSFGSFDPLNEIAKFAKERGIGCHSDCCLGSFINVFAEDAGFKLPNQFDFRIEGVTSISTDPHKFCYGPKGASLLLFRTKELRRRTFFGVTEWNGGLYVTPTVAGSRAGSVIAGTWAALMKQGRDGFIEKAKNILGAAQKMREELAKIPDVYVCSTDETCVVSFTCKKVNAITVAEQMEKKFKWNLSKLQHPPSCHIVVTDANYHHWKEFAPNVQACHEIVKSDPMLSSKGDAAMYGVAATVPDKSVIQDALNILLEEVLEL